MTLTFGTHKASWTHLVDCIYQLLYNRLQLFLKKILCLTFFPYKSIRGQIWPWHKTGQGHPSDIIWSNLVVLEFPMLHTNFHGHRPFGSREDDFFRFLTYMGMAANLVRWNHLIKLSFPHPMEAPLKIWLQSVKQFLRKKKWKCWIWVSLDQGQWMTLTFDIHIGSWTHLVNCNYQLWYHRLQ